MVEEEGIIRKTQQPKCSPPETPKAPQSKSKPPTNSPIPEESKQLWRGEKNGEGQRGGKSKGETEELPQEMGEERR
ncbi:hypothetical protein GBA52_016409 [Prunus armeniaca]|nr:hypothetical protein GBA52_016409 [Prunus armeniaca]